jgi:hypothetical protein
MQEFTKAVNVERRMLGFEALPLVDESEERK